jgi:hypothetical protein
MAFRRHSILFTRYGEFAGRTEIANCNLAMGAHGADLIMGLYGIVRLLAASEAGFLTRLRPHVRDACQLLSEEGLLVRGELNGAIPERRILSEEDSHEVS